MRTHLTIAALIAAGLAGLASAKDVPPPEPAQKPDWQDVRKQAETKLRVGLFDPSSAQIRYLDRFHWGYVDRGFKNWGWVTCGTLNAKNRYGGYIGEQDFAILVEDGKVTTLLPKARFRTSCNSSTSGNLQPELTAPSQVFPQSTPAATSVADELAKLAALRDKGIITEAEFATMKAKLIGAAPR